MSGARAGNWQNTYLNEEDRTMCETCGCGLAGKPVQYECDCGDDCACSVIEFDQVPSSVPYCCGVPMRRVK